MLRTGLTGGIGSGKSTVAAALAGRGALVVDADAIAREVVAPGGPAYAPVVARFGPDVLLADGALDRRRLGALVFSDPAARADLESITHPPIVTEILAKAAAAEGAAGVLVVDVPLLDGAGVARYGFDAVVVVDAPVEVAVARLVGERGMSEEEARARVAAQVGREERLALADVVVDNSGSRADLDAAVARLWRDLSARAATRPG